MHSSWLPAKLAESSSALVAAFAVLTDQVAIGRTFTVMADGARRSVGMCWTPLLMLHGRQGCSQGYAWHSSVSGCCWRCGG